MQVTHPWSKLYIHRYKIVLALLLLISTAGMAQVRGVQQQKSRWIRKNNPNYDAKKLTYGFLIGLHTSIYQVNYADAFVTPAFDTVHSVTTDWSSGFSLGFIVNYKLTDLLDFRITPKVAFYEQKVSYIFTDDTPRQDKLVETTMVELPILLKYKSERRGNARMYMIGGITPGIEASGKRGDNEEETLDVKSSNVSLDFGLGFDLYYPLFKFSPEIRFSHGLVNMLGDTRNAYGQPLTRVNTNTITVYFLFQ